MAENKENKEQITVGGIIGDLNHSFVNFDRELKLLEQTMVAKDEYNEDYELSIKTMKREVTFLQVTLKNTIAFMRTMESQLLAFKQVKALDKEAVIEEKIEGTEEA